MATLASTSSPVARAGPEPLIGVVMDSLPPAVSLGILTWGDLLNVPVTLTDVFGLEAELPDEPQPTRARPASSGTISAAAVRRMGNPQWVTESWGHGSMPEATPAYPL